jgi:hypothetical protein
VSPTPYRVLVTGSRDWDNAKVVRDALWETLGWAPANRPAIVVHGDCPTGADRIAKMWVRTSGGIFTATEEPHPANWRPNGVLDRSAGLRRNAEMVALGADICLAFILNNSRGASHTARLAEQAGIPVRRWTA